MPSFTWICKKAIYKGIKFEFSHNQWLNTYNPSYSGGRDQEDQGSKPARANSSRDPSSKKPITKKQAGGVAQGVGPNTTKRKKKNLNWKIGFWTL
jgi:hypothetical protein